MSWGRFVLRRFVLTGITLLIVSLTIFVITEIIPGDIAQVILGQEATEESLTALRHRMGLDRPAHIRYLTWVWHAAQGDLGESLYYGQPIGPLLAARLRNSVFLAVFAFVIGVPLALLLGTVAGLTPRRLPDHVITVASLSALSVPEFASGLALIFVFGVWLKWAPASSIIEPDANLFGALGHLVLPVITLSLAMMAHIARMTRAGLIEVMNTEYIRTARLKGLSWPQVVFKHGLRNALLPTVTVVAMYVGWLVGGLILVETVFAYPGIGRLLILSIEYRDVPMLQSTGLLIASIRVGSNFAADVLYAYLNPRIRY
jgi:peptide/nickel transport system permease protein